MQQGLDSSKFNKNTRRGNKIVPSTYHAKPFTLSLKLYSKKAPLGQVFTSHEVKFGHLISKGLIKNVQDPPSVDASTPCTFKYHLSVMPSKQTSDDIGGLAIKQAIGTRDSDQIVAITGQEIKDAYGFYGKHAEHGNKLVKSQVQAQDHGGGKAGASKLNHS